jgi:TonB-dependent starch-binding outer membrane protein SusC
MEKNESFGGLFYCSLKKTLKIMRNALILLFLGVLQAHAIDTYSQKTRLSLNFLDTELTKVLDKIETESEFFFLYNEKLFDTERKVNITADNQLITVILDDLFKGTNVKYSIVDRKIILAPDYLTSVSEQQQQKKITGTVTQKNGTLLAGVNVVVTGTTQGTQTDNAGKYTIDVPQGAKTLQFSFIGMETQEVSIGSLSQINVIMAESAIGLEEVVVIGYGTQKKKDLTGAISQIDPTKMEEKITSNATDLLRNSIAGLNIPLSTNPKGSIDMKDVLIRGINSLKASNTPLIVLDGMIYEGDLADISSLDIERIDVMKDASSAAVYGSRSSNGVISITTKKGKPGVPTITMAVTMGLVTPLFIRPVLSPEGYRDMRQNLFKQLYPKVSQPGYYDNPNNLPGGVTLEQWKAYGGATGDPIDIWLARLSFQSIEVENYKKGNTIDWADKLFQTGLRKDYLTSINGGTERINYYWSINYTDNDGFVVGEKYKSIRSRLNLESKITNFLTVGLNASFANKDEGSIPAETRRYSMFSPYGSVYEADGKTLKYFVHDDPICINPFVEMTYNDRFNKYKDLNSKIYAIVTLPLGFSYQINLINNFTDQRNYYHISSDNPGNSTGGYASRENTNTYSWTIDNIIKWSKIVGIHNFDLTLLANKEKWQNWYNLMENSKFFPSDILGYNNMNAGTAPIVSSNDMSNTRDALLGRLNYILNAKYYVTLSLRKDGYSGFGKANHRAVFPSAALAWKISGENFFHIKPLDFLKLRLSWGGNGNSAIDSYAALAAMTSGKYLLADNNGSAYSVSMLQINKLANDDLQWEKTTATNCGIDFGLFKSKLNGALELYFSKTTNLLVDRSLPIVTGFKSITTNLGQINNKGVELTLNSVNINLQNKFLWQTSFNCSFNRNKIVHLYGDMVDVYDDNGNVIGQKEVDDYQNHWFIGHAVEANWDYLPNGIWQEEDAAEAYSYGGYLPGQFRRLDVNGDGKYTEIDDKGFLGYSKPQFFWSMTNDFLLYKNISLGFTVYGQHGWKGNFTDIAGSDRYSNYDLPYWTPENRSTKWARMEVAGETDVANYINRGFVRLSAISLGYTLPDRITNLLHVKLMKIFGSVQNAFVWTKWPGWDPEYSSGPVPRYFNLGVNVKL